MSRQVEEEAVGWKSTHVNSQWLGREFRERDPGNSQLWSFKAGLCRKFHAEKPDHYRDGIFQILSPAPSVHQD